MTITNEERDALRKMNAEQFQAIRTAYYKAVEGLRSLADALEIADIDFGAGELMLSEHYIACEAIDVMKKSTLGKIL